jgi:hypothetical protein
MRVCVIMYYMSLGDARLPCLHAIAIINRILEKALSSEQNLAPNSACVFLKCRMRCILSTLHEDLTTLD